MAVRVPATSAAGSAVGGGPASSPAVGVVRLAPPQLASANARKEVSLGRLTMLRVCLLNASPQVSRYRNHVKSSGSGAATNLSAEALRGSHDRCGFATRT